MVRLNFYTFNKLLYDHFWVVLKTKFICMVRKPYATITAFMSFGRCIDVIMCLVWHHVTRMMVAREGQIRWVLQESTWLVRAWLVTSQHSSHPHHMARSSGQSFHISTSSHKMVVYFFRWKVIKVLYNCESLCIQTIKLATSVVTFVVHLVLF